MADKKYNLRPNTKFRLDHETCATCGLDEELEVIGTNKEFYFSTSSFSFRYRSEHRLRIAIRNDNMFKPGK